MSLAQRLDAADGVMDGKYFGRPIIETSSAAPRYRTSTAAALDAADGVIDGKYYGRPIIETSSAAPRYRTSTAAALDAADGVIDGRYFGRPIVETAGGSVTRRYVRDYPTTSYVSPRRYYGSTYYGGARVAATRPYASSTALALDAADGVIDGKYYGRPIVETSGYPVYRSGYPVSASVTRYGGRYYDDAAVTYGARRYAGGYYGPASVTRYGRYYDDLAYPRRYIDDGYYGGYYGGAVTRPGYRSSTALALDAADGVIDGKYFGRPIVETGAPVRRYV